MRILVIEDDSDIKNFLRVSLRAEGFEVDSAPDGESGSFLARSTDYDLVILDYNLPKKDGREVCVDIRQRGKTTPIIVLTVNSELADKVSMLNLGADDYITKPFLFEELLSRVKAVLRRPVQVITNTLQCADLVLDSITHSVRREENEILLTRKEFMLLEYLMRNAGQVLSRGKILGHVWDNDTDPFSNTLETHILNLRCKIDRGSNCKLIHTISGYGYKIEVRNKG